MVMENEAAMTREPGAPSEFWLILQRIDDLSAHIKDLRQHIHTTEGNFTGHVKDLRQEIKEVRQDLKQDIEGLRVEVRRLDNELAAIRRDNRSTWLGLLAIWATIMAALVGLYIR